MTADSLTVQFREKAGLVSAIVHDIGEEKNAFKKVIDICLEKPRHENLMPDENSGDGQKIICAPCLDDESFEAFKPICSSRNIRLIRDGLRDHAGGIDVGFTPVNYGIAETGTLVLSSDDENVRLATMLCETHVALLSKSHIRPTALDMSQELGELTKRPSSYTAFITGASRTADIERVLALGVHGPLELHIMLTED